MVKKYRYGFNGQEKDDEIKGNGNSINYQHRIHDPRLGRFLSTDPLTMVFPWYSPYQFAGNKPIWAIDQDGLEEFFRTDYYNAVDNLYRTEIQMVTQKGAQQGIQTVHHSSVTEIIDDFGNSSFNITFTGSRIGTTQGVNAFSPPLASDGFSGQIRQEALKTDATGNPVPKPLSLYQGMPNSINITTTDLRTNTTSTSVAVQGQLVPATSGGHFNVGYFAQLLDANNKVVGTINRDMNDPRSTPRKWDESNFVFDRPGVTPSINPPNLENNVPNYVGGARTTGSNFRPFGHVNAKGGDGAPRNVRKGPRVTRTESSNKF